MTTNLLGTYLKDRRGKLDPAALGFPLKRRRTPGLRREEVAHRANVSATWYTWLEQGRGGAPSADVVDRIARALMLTDVEREHLFLLALGRPPEVQYQAAEGVTPRLQRVLDSLEISPAYVKTSTWDVVAWNRAGAAKSVAALVDELSRESPEFATLWRDHDVRDTYESPKRVRHPKAGVIALEYSTFAVDGRPDLGLVIYNPATPADAEKIRSLVKPRAPWIKHRSKNPSTRAIAK